MSEIYKKLLAIQSELEAPKNQFNSFGKYHYRSCEDILLGLKKLLKDLGCIVTIDDEIVLIGERYYVKATAKLIDAESGEGIENTAYAREEESKKGMDGSQVTGASSSYARKYALNGLFAIDDAKDSDTTNKGDKDDPKQSQQAPRPFPNTKPPTEELKPHCKNCNVEISIQEHDYSVNVFKEPLCRKCQATKKKASGQ